MKNAEFRRVYGVQTTCCHMAGQLLTSSRLQIGLSPKGASLAIVDAALLVAGFNVLFTKNLSAPCLLFSILIQFVAPS
ncbi:hypothetical protein LQZ18_15560 [Lachnospiraceae bacterium ZAX-1]